MKSGFLNSLTIGLCLCVIAILTSRSGAQVISPSSVLLAGDVEGELNRTADGFGGAIGTGDFNHDGFADLAVGAPNRDSEGAANSGAVFVYYGSAAGLMADGAEVLVQGAVVASSSEIGDRFGSALAAGDIDADGYDDLVVGVPFEDTGGASDTGAIAVFYGSADGLLPSRSESISQASLTNSFNEEDDHFGACLAVADFNRDGFDDVVVGVPNEDFIGVSDAGMIGVFFGSGAGLLPANVEEISQESVDGAINEEGDHFGSSVSAGDFNRDGFGDVAVGIPGEDAGGISDIGMVSVLFGSVNGLLPARSEVFSQASLDDAENEAGDQFGWSLCSGDFDADGFDDLVVGIPFEDVSVRSDSGEIGVFFGSADGLIPSRSQLLDQATAGGRNSSSDKAGHSLAAADFDGDGIDDLVAGVPYNNSSSSANNGIVMVFFGSASGSLSLRALSLEQSEFGGVEANSDEFGSAAAAGDFDANGLADLALAAPGENLLGAADAGAVYVGTFADGDGDGLADTAEEGELGTDPTRADSDGDGMGDGAEIDAGSDPLDPQSVLRILSIEWGAATGNVSLKWSSVQGRFYRVERSSALAGAGWLDLTGDDPVPARAGEVTSFTDMRPIQNGGRAYYRVRSVR